MKSKTFGLTAPIGAVAISLLSHFLTTTETEAKTYTQKNYIIEVQMHSLHWSSGSESFTWVSFYETMSKTDAQNTFQFLHWAFLNGHLNYLNSVDGAVITTVVDIRLREETVPVPVISDSISSDWQLRPIGRSR